MAWLKNSTLDAVRCDYYVLTHQAITSRCLDLDVETFVDEVNGHMSSRHRAVSHAIGASCELSTGTVCRLCIILSKLITYDATAQI